MKISEIMRPGPCTIPATESLGVAHATMTRAGIRHLPVLRADRLVGMLSERDVLAARVLASEDDRLWWSVPVSAAMCTPHTAAPDDSLTEVAGRMAVSKIGAMPIVERGKLLGIATITDVLDAEVRVAMGSAPTEKLTCVDAMTPWPITVSLDVPIFDAVQLIVRHRIRHLPVVDSTSALIGMLSERDVREAIGDPVEYLSLQPKLVTREPWVRDVMTRSVVTVSFDTPLAEAARMFAEHRVSALPVLDRFGALLGILSYVDALHVLAK